MKQIFVVFGKTGEYSDRSEWAVIAYTSEDDAKAHVLKATEYAKAWLAHTQSEEFIDQWWTPEAAEKLKAANPMDPSFSMEYTGTEYYYAPIELRKKFTTPEPIQ